MISWLDDFSDPTKSVFIAPQCPTVCQIMFCLYADNKSEWNTKWVIHGYISNGIDEPANIQTMLVPAPEQAFMPTMFEFSVIPGYQYIVQRDEDSTDDTALGMVEIIQTAFMMQGFASVTQSAE